MLAGLGSPTHIILILLVILVLFGAKRLPEMGRSLGRGIQEFKEGINTKDEPEENRPKDIEEGRSNANPVPKDKSRDEEATGARGPGPR